MKKLLSFYLLMSGCSALLSAQQQLTEHTLAYDSTLKATAKLDDLAWLTGRWSGEGFGGYLEEIWAAPMGGQMVATFRMLSEGKPSFYEICLIAEENNSLVYKVKHFNPDLSAWEEKGHYITFPLVKIEGNAVYFNGLTMVLEGNTCTHFLAMKQKDGTYREAKLVYQRGATNDKAFPAIHISQEEQHLARLQEINRDIWTPFSAAYATNDAEKYIALHTPDFIRATGGQYPEVKNRDAYQQSVQTHFNYNKEQKRRVEIAFTFFERVAGENTASERGIYRYTAIAADGTQSHFYGKFHVFLRKIEGVWKIAVDYDSNEDGSIGEGDFNAGLAPEVFSK
ncbi:MAG TPA: DUF6265 family protein [Saprospiraceae bacterium]|nr:DUF6265 family protein [Saprospiraceae bacterium]HMQ84409.1 DUF6265 family protein [Saprospiraceae bacterium]